jgi:hypothetical protein
MPRIKKITAHAAFSEVTREDSTNAVDLLFLRSFLRRPFGAMPYRLFEELAAQVAIEAVTDVPA